MARSAIIAGFLLVVGWLYSWTPASSPARAFTRQPTEFYPELSDALLHGHLYLARPPDPRLVALPDPYDPGQNAPYRIDNLSYFRGHYYLYMGLVPALAVFIPIKLLTGFYVSQELAAVLLCLVGAAASAAALLHLCDSGPAATPPLVAASLGLVLCLANGYYVVLPGTIAQSVAVAGGYAFGMVALWCCAHALTARRAAPWFALASLAFGAAIASRPNYIVASVALLPPWLARSRLPDQRWSRASWTLALAVILPLAAVVSGLLVYNYARFGAPFEFGQHYMLGKWNQLRLANQGTAEVGANAWQYLLSPGQSSGYFPFITAPSSVALGVLRHIPWLWLLPGALWILAVRRASGPLRWLGLSALLLALANLLSLLFLPSGNAATSPTSANSRYVLDFLPGLILAVAAATAIASRRTGAPRAGRRAFELAIVALAAASGVVGLSLHFQQFAPETYRPLARFMNFPGYVLRSLGRPAFGPLELEVTFPSGQTGRYEPLVSTGDQRAANLLYVFYTGEKQIQFGLIGTGLPGPLSDPVPITYGVAHHLRVSLGSLYPPAGYPLPAGLTAAEAGLLRRSVVVAVDGRTEFSASAYFYPASPASVQFGRNPYLAGFGEDRFSGTLRLRGRAALLPLPAGQFPVPAYGTVRLTLRFAQDKMGHCEPLVVSGVPQAGDLIYVRYLDHQHISLGLDHWGGAGAETPPLPLDFAAAHLIEISMGSLFPPLGRAPALASIEQQKRQVRILLDGKTVLSIDHGTYDSDPSDLTIGQNAIGGSLCDYAFTGKIERTERMAPALSAAGAR